MGAPNPPDDNPGNLGRVAGDGGRFMSRLWSPAGGVPDRPPPFGVWVGVPAPVGRDPAPPEGPKPPLWRRSVALLTVAGTLATAMVAGSIVAMVDRLGASTPPPPVPVTAPTLTSLNGAIATGEQFLDGLYKPLGRAGAVQSEHYGLPIRVRFPGYGRWVLLGQGDNGTCEASACPLPTGHPQPRVGLRHRGLRAALRHPVLGRRAAAAGQGRLGRRRRPVPGERDRAVLRRPGDARPRSGSTTSASAPSRPGRSTGQPPVLRRSFPIREVGHLRSFRYTVRHATQLAWLHAVSRNDDNRSTALARFMLKAGFVPGRDLRAAIFGRGRDAPRDFSYRHEPFLDAYGDCQLDPPATPLAYPYRSKACVGNVQPYLLAARYDTLLPAIEALQALNRGESPDNAYRDQSALLPMVTTSASRTADELERHFDRLGFGVPRCTPLGCDRERASAVRTFTFGMLETVLGYSGGEVGRRHYADAVANLALRVQIGEDGVVRAADRVAYRPALRGGFLSYWDADRRYLKPAGVVQAMADRFNMPPEYLGLRPTDSETGFDAYAFLALYRCAKYQVGCKLVGSASPTPTP